MSEGYGRRKEDAMPDLTPEMFTSLTDTQKVNLRIIQNLTSMNTAINDLQHDVNIHNRLLVTGNGDLPLPERMRNAENFIKGMKNLGSIIGGALIIQTIAFLTGIILAIVRFLPLLERLATP